VESPAKSVRPVRSTEFFRKIYEQASTGIAITDWQGVFQECNPAYCALLGYTEEELRNIDFTALIHPEDRHTNVVLARRLQTGEISSFDIENRYIHKSGKPVWVHKFVSVLPGEKGEPAHLIALVTDTSDRHLAEQKLRESQARLRMALEVAAGGTWSRDLRTNQTQWDDHMTAMYGLPKGEQPSFEAWAASIHPEDSVWITPRIMKVLGTPGDDRWDFEFRAIRPEGTIVWIQSFGRVERDAQGQALNISGINFDITNRKRRERNSAFSAELTARLSQLSTVNEIMQAFGARVAEFLKVSAVQYWDVDEICNEARLYSLWLSPGTPALPSFVRLTDYLNEDFVRSIRAGKTAVICDTETDPRVNPVAIRATQQRTAVIVPFFQGGKWKFALNLNDPNPRNWREDEIELIEELANKVFPCLERARVEAKLRDSEERYRGFAEQVSDGIFVADVEGRYVDANRAGCKMFGYTLEELKSITVGDVLDPSELARLPEQFGRLARGETVRNDWLFRRKDESHFVGELVASRLSDGRLQGVVRDITERKAMELAARASQQQLQSYLDHAADGIYVVESESGRILNVNNRAVHMLGYSRDELLKMSVTDIECAHPASGIPEIHRRAAREVVTVEGIHRRKDGSKFPVEIRMTSLAPAEPNFVLAIVRDVTERKQAEAVLQDESRRKDEFLALLGHELRNPLAAISTATQVISSGVTADRRADIEGMMARQVNLMSRLLDDLLDLGRIKHGHIELKKERIDLADFIQKAAASLQHVIANRRQELLIRLPSESVQFMADRSRLEQIISNLLSNASKYTNPGGTIELSGTKDSTELVFHCRDNGRGVLPEFQTMIFEPFTRGQNTHDSRGEASLGIGLALAKQLTELHGGTISVESAGANRGSDFIVRLPLIAPGFDNVVEADRKPPNLPINERSIVVVEDNPDIAEVMGIALELNGYIVHKFPDGPSALAAVANLKPDAVLLDIGLPGMNGYEVAAEMKKLANLKGAVLVALSGFKPRERERGDGNEFDHYLTKPVDIETLVTLLKSKISTSREAA
jgi:PAS domain S-box-containing protein